MGPSDAAAGYQGLLDKNLATGVIAILFVALTAVWLWAVSLSRDLRKVAEATAAHVATSTVALTSLVRAVEELRQAKRPRREAGGVPTLGPEPKTGGGQ